MRILYGIVGEGMGHATRSRVLLDHLLTQGHEVRVVVSGHAHPFLVDCFQGREGIAFEEIHGLSFEKSGSRIDMPRTLWTNLQRAPRGLWKNVSVYRKLQREGFQPDLVMSDFESWAYLYALNHRIPLISIDNQQVLPRCHHTSDITQSKSFSYRLARWFVQAKLPGAYHYLASSFFFPPVTAPRTSLMPPILRQEVLDAKRSKGGNHILVYHPAVAEDATLEALQQLPYHFKVYGAKTTKSGQFGNLTLCPFSQTQFVEDLRTARAVVAGGGFSLMCEAVHLGVPMLTIPLQDQFEQEMNARYLHKLGYGTWATSFDPTRIDQFIQHSHTYRRALAQYSPRDNSMIFDCIDELLHNIELGEQAPTRLRSPALGKFEGPLLPAKWRRRLALTA